MAQLSGFTKAFNLSMGNMLTFAQMRQGQETRKAQLKQRERQQVMQQIGMMIPFTDSNKYAPAQVKQALGMIDGLWGSLDPKMKGRFAGLDITTPEYKKASTAWMGILKSVQKGDSTIQQGMESFLKWRDDAQLSGDKKKAATKSFKEGVETFEAKQKALKEDQVRLDKIARDETARIAKSLQWEEEEARKQATQEETARHHRATEKRTTQEKIPTSGEALKTVASLTKAKATFDKTGEMDLLMAEMFPEYAKKKGSISQEEKEQVKAAYDEAIAYYKQFTPKDEKRQKAIAELKRQNTPITEANIDYVMDLLNE